MKSIRMRILVWWYFLLIKLKIQRLEFHIEEVEIEGEERFVSLVCEPRWFWSKRTKIDD